MRGKILISIIILIAVGLIVIFAPRSNYFNKENHVYKIGLIDWPGFYPILVAEKLGLFKKQGVAVQLIYAKDNPEMNEKLRVGAVDMAYGVFADYVLMKGRGSGIKFIQIADYSKSDSLVGISQIKKVSDLKGKTIGIGDINSFSEYFVITLLRHAGLTENDVKFKLVNFFDITDSLKKNEIQAGHTWDPELSKAISQGFHVIATATDVPGSVIDGLAINEESMRNKDDLKKIFSAFYEAQELLLKNPESYSEMISQEFQTDPALVLKSIQNGAEYFSLQQNVESFSRREDVLESMSYKTRDASSFFMDRGQLKSSVEPRDFLSSEVLNEIAK